MSGDLKLTPISAAFPAEAKTDAQAFREKTTDDQKISPKVESDADKEKIDPTEQRRQLLKEALEINKSVPSGRLVIERDDDTGRYVQKVLDPDSGEVLKQWPEEQFLELAKSMGEAYGLLVDREV